MRLWFCFFFPVDGKCLVTWKLHWDCSPNKDFDILSFHTFLQCVFYLSTKYIVRTDLKPSYNNRLVRYTERILKCFRIYLTHRRKKYLSVYFITFHHINYEVYQSCSYHSPNRGEVVTNEPKLKGWETSLGLFQSSAVQFQWYHVLCCLRFLFFMLKSEEPSLLFCCCGSSCSSFDLLS